MTIPFPTSPLIIDPTPGRRNDTSIDTTRRRAGEAELCSSDPGRVCSVRAAPSQWR